MDPDRDLARRAAAGDEMAFAALYERFAPRVLATAARVLGDAHRAADVVQEAFVKIHAALPSFAGDASLALWIHKIAVHEALNAVRTDRRRRARETRVKPASQAPADESQALFDRLSPPLRAVAVLRYTHDFSYDEIADALDLPTGTVRSRLYQAHQILRGLDAPDR